MDNLPSYALSRVLEGPFSDVYYKVIVDGKLVPHVKAHLQSGTEDEWWLMLDNRLGFGPFTAAVVEQIAPVLANGMAIAAGYGAFGVAEKMNLYNCQIMCIGSVETEP